MGLIKLKQILKKSIYIDSILNILASLVLTIATQLITYPYLGRNFSKHEYGMILTLMGVINAIGVSIGNSLNNTRLLLQSKYERKNLNGDFNLIFLCMSIISAFFIYILSIYFFKIHFLDALGCVIVTFLVSFRAYYSVGFRIIIDYKKVLATNIWGLCGYLIGIILTSVIKSWLLIFIIGELFSCVYIFLKSHIVRENFKKTILIKKSLTKYFFLMSSAILSNLMLYMDRFLIFPLLGAGLVSSYTVASYLGKTAGIIMNPISGVLLTYYAKENNLSIRNFYKRVLIFLLGSMAIYFGILLAGIPVTRILYPTLVYDSFPYFKIANLAAIALIFGNTIQPTLLRYCHSKWQLITQGLYFIVYLSSSYYGMLINGLVGFCYAVLFSNFFRVIFMILVITFTLIKRKDKL